MSFFKQEALAPRPIVTVLIFVGDLVRRNSQRYSCEILEVKIYIYVVSSFYLLFILPN